MDIILATILFTATPLLIGTRVVQVMTEKLAGFRPTYGTAFLATLIGYLASFIGYPFEPRIEINLTSNPTELRLGIIGLFVQAAFYAFIKSPEGVHLGFGRACIISLVARVCVALFWIAIILFASIVAKALA